jgi:hypothetical protein
VTLLRSLFARSTHDQYLYRYLYPLFIAWSVIGCGIDREGKAAEILFDETAKEAARDSLKWMTDRVDLMVKHKADCDEMARQIARHQLASQDQVSAWRAAKAQEWIEAQARFQPEYKQRLTTLIAKGDIVYSYCSYYMTFRATLKQTLKP